MYLFKALSSSFGNPHLYICVICRITSCDLITFACAQLVQLNCYGWSVCRVYWKSSNTSATLHSQSVWCLIHAEPLFEELCLCAFLLSTHALFNLRKQPIFACKVTISHFKGCCRIIVFTQLVMKPSSWTYTVWELQYKTAYYKVIISLYYSNKLLYTLHVN